MGCKWTRFIQELIIWILSRLNSAYSIYLHHLHVNWYRMKLGKQPGLQVRSVRLRSRTQFWSVSHDTYTTVEWLNRPHSTCSRNTSNGEWSPMQRMKTAQKGEWEYSTWLRPCTHFICLKLKLIQAGWETQAIHVWIQHFVTIRLEQHIRDKDNETEVDLRVPKEHSSSERFQSLHAVRPFVCLFVCLFVYVYVCMYACIARRRGVG
jgi:hypothetical protein